MASKHNWWRRMLSFCSALVSQPKWKPGYPGPGCTLFLCESSDTRSIFRSQHIRFDGKRYNDDIFWPFCQHHHTSRWPSLPVRLLSFRRASASHYHRFMFGPFKNGNLPKFVPSSLRSVRKIRLTKCSSTSMCSEMHNQQFFFHRSLTFRMQVG